ncbi:YbfB/YjiJ family MFS transporter [Zavarzinia sp. CC-PAN008]|uniref:YbfB/YjiJ family MFS transporter n=1 Tax=Zavarzinia sp. CC-PAN008 TaxID=3243332 RepID=UPI003F74810F
MSRTGRPDATAGRAAFVILVLALGPAIGLGISRFAYALVLPDMRDSLGWTYAEAGFMNTINAAGYLLGALLSAPVVRGLGAWPAIMLGSGLATLAMAATGATDLFAPLAAARLAAGVGAAFAMVAGGTLAAGVAVRQGRATALLLGLFYVGPGIGIALSGAIVPFLLAAWGPGSWWRAWLVLAALSGGLMLVLALARGERLGPGATGAAARQVPLRAMAPILLGYLGFGAGYIAYMTFMIAWVREAGGTAPGLQAGFWTLLGLSSMAAPFVWSGVLGRLPGGLGVAALTAVTLAGAVLPLLSAHPAVLVASAVVFGSAFLSVVAGTTVFVRRNLAEAAWPGGIAAMTIAFGLGQTAGPLAIGALTDALGTLDAGLWASIALLAAGSCLAALQRDLGAATGFSARGSGGR